MSLKNTVLASLLIVELEKKIADLTASIDTFADKVRTDPVYAFSSYADDAFKTAAKIAVRRELLYHYQHVVDTSDESVRVTRENISRLLLERGMRGSATPRSTSPCSNLAEQHRLDEAIRIAQGDSWDFTEFRDAQRNDAEVMAEYDREWAEHKAYDDMRAEADADNKAFDRRARRAARKA